ncbi:MAG TPA: cysteine--tRNA ligase [Candidatus Hydrogenedentes bacterium]|jgi:cysteinyl-tRNA synthetase|nr:cysteine--tRNA ligase [Candidatus Hydrogenedentota bacterium]HPJ98374.1 cysteine--tRNA ligase [Candidatus Hydrogenedentota bacterium]
MSIVFYNTLTKRKDTFVPLEAGKAGIYTCGPTVYNYAHIGNLRTFLFEDLLRRHLEYRGYAVTHVMNLTDVEDKIIRTCRETGESLESLTGRYAQAFLEDLDTLRILRPHRMPRATETIPEIVDFIKILRDRGHTYEVDGSIYFRLASFSGYGKLSGFDIDTLKANAGGRIDSDEYETEDARDFALWKAWDEDDGDVYWDTELGKGRPGWHIECSCMSRKHLGDSFDIHCGGVDLVFPHHENEIAQSEAATGKPFVSYWLHAGHLQVEGRKMAKSYGNTYTLRDLLDKGYDPVAIRWALSATHYREPSNFTFNGLEAAAQSVRRIQDFRLRLAEVEGAGADPADEAAACEKAFGEALDDDLNISAALAAVFDFVRDTNKRIDDGSLGAEGAANALALLDRLDAVCALFPAKEADAVPQDVLNLVNDRQRARREKDFARADEIRDTLKAMGWVVEDTPDGPRVKRA